MMRFNFPEGHAPQTVQHVEVGNVYASKNTHKTVAWVVMNVTGNTVHLIGLDAEGEVSSTQSYNLHTLERRAVIGRVDLAAMEFDVVMEDTSNDQ